MRLPVTSFLSLAFKKFLAVLLILWGVATVVFFLFHVLPGDPARLMMGQRTDQKSIEILKEELGLNRPLSGQYFHFLRKLSPVDWDGNMGKGMVEPESPENGKLPVIKFSRGSLILKKPDLGRSYQSRKAVVDILAETLPNTFVLAFTSIFLASIAGIWLGALCALRKDSWFDRSALFLASMGMSLPSFFAAILIAWVFAYLLGDITGLPVTGNLREIDDLGEGPFLHLKNLVLPTLTLGIRPLSILLQLTRNALLDVLSQDYIRTAKAKGLRPSRILWHHAFKNALNPVITAISGWFASLMAGVVFVEYIFGYKGLGYVLVEALNHYDFPLIMACVLTISALFVLINLVVDWIYIWLDPRIGTSTSTQSS